MWKIGGMAGGLLSVVSDEIKDVLARCYASTKVCAKVLFPERFFRPFSRLHDEIFKVLDDRGIQKAVIAAPRGFGKTSITNLAYIAKNILFREKRFIVNISNTATQAMMQSENLKRELMANVYINELFGNMKTDMFSKEQWVTSSGTMVLPRGSGQQVRGILFGNSRPDLIIADDLEDSESVKNEEQRKKLKEWFFADVMNSVDRASGDWKIIVIGTLLHEDSLLANLLEDSSWHKTVLSICDDEYNSNWEDFMTTDEVKQLVEQYRKQGMLDVFYREYRNMAISTEDAVFKSTYFKYADEEEIRKKQHVENVVIVDPAKTVKLHSADSAVICWGIDLDSGMLHQRDLVASRMHPDELIDTALEMCRIWNARVLAIEVTSLNEFITYPVKNEIIRRRLNVELVELNARGKKEDRIAQLVPFYRRGMVTHNKANCGQLEAQLLSFPRSKRWDCMDAAAYIVELLEIGERYFFPKSSAIGKGEYDELMKDDYADMPILGDDIPVEEIRWRII